jgi:arginase
MLQNIARVREARNEHVQAIYVQDHPKKACPRIILPLCMKIAMRRTYQVIGACSCWGAQMRECEQGPRCLVEGRVFERLQHQGVPISRIEMLFPRQRFSEKQISLAESLPLIHAFNLQLAKSVQQAEGQGLFPVVVGGDHTNAVGTWNGIRKPFGLLWIDAHMDAHTMETSPSHAYHGMPVAALLGYGIRELAQLCSPTPVLHPNHLALIGIRSFEAGEDALLKKLNVKVYSMEEVRRRGVQEVLSEAIQHVTQKVHRFGVSLDLDVFSPEEAPGVGSPEPEGMQAKELLPELERIGKDPNLVAFEMVEFNPKKDRAHKTRELAFQILQAIMQ